MVEECIVCGKLVTADSEYMCGRVDCAAYYFCSKQCHDLAYPDDCDAVFLVPTLQFAPDAEDICPICQEAWDDCSCFEFPEKKM